MLYDYYKILEVRRDATLEEIKQAYRSKAKLVHPDVNDSPKAHELFTIINEAYEILTDRKKRLLHDVKLNYADATKAEITKKRQYYGTSLKNNSTNPVNVNYNWRDYQPKEKKTDYDYFKRSPVIYNLFFISGMFLGFIILFTILVGTYNKLWPYPFGFLAILGAILVRQGWRGIIGKKNIISGFVRFLKKKSN
ncbi:MAG TPA: DnaJ domain-containing protein [Bacteroidia bacterium]|jgi:curved DNA-binding protein CbpA|nr:DnaJ domain-containing protein [Bacteroidia bacterium]